MLETDTADASAEFRRLRPDHELWLAMRTAHSQLVEATGVVDELIARAPDGGTPSEENRVMAVAVGQQCAAFQDYVEARLSFAEFLLSRNSPAEPSPPPSWLARTASRYAVAALTIALLCPALFGVAYLLQARKQFRDLEAARDTMNTIVSQVRSQAAAPKAELVKPPAAQLPTPPRTAPAATQRKKPGAPSSYEFTLGPASRWARVGPVQVLVPKVDRERNRFDLFVRRGDLQYEKKQVRLHEAVWIDFGGGSAPVRVMADRILRYEVHGSLSSAPRPRGGVALTRQQPGD
uniref:Uncharacterized protein n=1 Tax=Solibacter usitatus (strain Ellin6076) TaxID=234267 RepID=Q01XX0_SOLUE